MSSASCSSRFTASLSTQILVWKVYRVHCYIVILYREGLIYRLWGGSNDSRAKDRDRRSAKLISRLSNLAAESPAEASVQSRWLSLRPSLLYIWYLKALEILDGDIILRYIIVSKSMMHGSLYICKRYIVKLFLHWINEPIPTVFSLSIPPHRTYTLAAFLIRGAAAHTCYCIIIISVNKYTA